MSHLKSIFSVSILSLFIQNAYSLEKNLDFYNNTNRYSVTGNVGDVKELSYNNKAITLIEGNESTYVTLNDNFPNKTYYQNQDVSLTNIISQNKGKELNYNNKNYKVIGYNGVNLVLQNLETKEYLFINDLKELKLPSEWVANYEKGLTAFFDNVINKNDLIFYSQLDNNLNYTNNYQIRLINQDKLKLVHYIDVQNSSDKTYENVNLSFFFGDMNINNQPIHFMRKSSMMEMARTTSSFNDNVAEFETDQFANVEVISITTPINIYPNFNRIKYTENDLDYHVITKINPINKEYGDISDSEILEYFKNSKLFNNYIFIKRNENKFIPNGTISVYEEYKGKDKLIIDTNIHNNSSKNIELLKNNNLDLKITNVNIQKVHLLTENKDGDKKEIYKKIVKSIKIKNEGKEQYKIANILKNMEYEYITIKPNQEIELTL